MGLGLAEPMAGQPELWGDEDHGEIIEELSDSEDSAWNMFAP